MVRRTTILFDEDVYERLVEPLRKALRSEDQVARLIHSEKVASVRLEEFEGFRRELPRRLESWYSTRPPPLAKATIEHAKFLK